MLTFFIYCLLALGVLNSCEVFTFQACHCAYKQLPYRADRRWQGQGRALRTLVGHLCQGVPSAGELGKRLLNSQLATSGAEPNYQLHVDAALLDPIDPGSAAARALNSSFQGSNGS